MKKVLITGANSYIGSSFEKYANMYYSSELSIDTVDMLDGSWKKKDFSPYDVIYHVAGIAHADVGKVSEEEKTRYYAINTDLAIETAEKAKKEGVGQFVFMSSAIIYGEAAPYGKVKRITKDTEPHPSNFYGDSKWQADKGVRRLASDSFKVTILRPPMIYGKGSKGNYPLLAKLAKKLPLFPKVKNERSMLYIENLCEFVCQVIIRRKDGIYWPQNSEYSSTCKLVKMISEVNGHSMFSIKAFNWMVRVASMLPGKIGRLTNKAFGNMVYDEAISRCDFDYQLVSVGQSIIRTEGNDQDDNMELNPLVSVITAAYNCDKTIGETIESVMSQTYSNWEMLIVNDCSSDNTVEVVKYYAERDHRIKLINHKVNSGAAKARNTAIDNSKGRFLAIIDSDDLWKKEKLRLQLDYMLYNGYAFTFTSYETFRSSKDTKRKLFRAPKRITYKQYLKNTIIGNLTVMIDKNKIPNFKIISGYLEDVLTWMYFLHEGYLAYGLKENLASYRVTTTSKSSNKVKNAKRYYDCLRAQPISMIQCVFFEICYLFNAVKKRVFGQNIKHKMKKEDV